MRFLKNFFKGTEPKEAMAWALYDFASSAYTMIFLVLVFPIYFREIVAGAGYGDFYWGLAGGLSILIGGLLAPFIGAMADYYNRRKERFIFFSLLAVAGSSFLFFTGPNMIIYSLSLFVITNIFFELASVLYDSFLPKIADEKSRGRISGLGYGLGYIGGAVIMILLYPLYGGGFENDFLYRLTFPLTALFFLIFALPSFIFIKGEKIQKKRENFTRMIKISLLRIVNTFKEIKKHKSVAWFLVGFYFLNDALVTLFIFISLYATTTLSISVSEVGIILIIMQIIGFFAVIFFGWLSDKKGPKKILLATILVWIAIVILLANAHSKFIFYLIAILAGTVIGASQAIARSWLSSLIPKDKQAEFFGFNGFASKVAATTGPIVFGVISSFTGSQRIAMLMLLPYLIIALVIFIKIPEKNE